MWKSAGRLRRPARAIATSALALLLILSNAPFASAVDFTATGGTITDFTQNGVKYRVHTFTSSGTFTVTGSSGNVWYLIVAGGGGGGGRYHGGGGGAGGYRSNNAYNYTVTAQSYTITVGGGGAGGVASGGEEYAGSNGENSVFATVTALGGGGGGVDEGAPGSDAKIGGSGGGGGSGTGGHSGAAGTAGQGFGGGVGLTGSPYTAGGGGGAGAAGADGTTTGGNGGNGIPSSISGSYVTYAGGGGGSIYISGTPGTGGAGGGGNGSTGQGSSGVANTGGGGGGSERVPALYDGGAGGSGIVIIRYPLGVTKFSIPLKSGLTGYWPFNKLDMNGLTAYDRSGLGKNGTLANGPVATSSFMSGQAMSFASTSSNKISVPYAWSNFISSTNGTISVWVKATGNIPPADAGGACSPGQGIVAGKSNMYLYLCRANMSGVDSLLAGVYDGGHKRVSTPFTVGAWTHLVWVRDSSKLYLYKNGVLAGSILAGGTGSVGDEMQIGQTSTDNGSLSFDGSIDDVRVYSRTLTAKEIKSLYQSTAGSKVNVSQNAKVTSGLVGLWSFDGPDMAGVTAYDRSGNGNNGTLAGGVLRVIGKLSQALKFNGVDGYIDAGDVDTLDGASAITVSAWIKQSALAANQTIIAKWDFSTQGNFAMQTNQVQAVGNIKVFIAPNLTDTGSYSVETTNAPHAVGRWDHVLFTYSGSTGITKIYVNGLESASAGSAPATLTAGGTATVKIGKFGGSLDSYFNGSIDDVRIYNRTLSAAEVKLLYNSGKGLLIR